MKGFIWILSYMLMCERMRVLCLYLKWPLLEIVFKAHYIYQEAMVTRKFLGTSQEQGWIIFGKQDEVIRGETDKPYLGQG